MKRDEFKDKLNNIYSDLNILECITVLITQDQTKIDKIRAKYQKGQNLISHYLFQYDIAKDDTEKNLVIGSVSADIEREPFSLSS